MPYVVDAVTVMHVLFFFVACVYAARLLGCKGDSNACVGSGGCVVAVSAYMGGTRSSGVLSSAGDGLEMSVVRGVLFVWWVCSIWATGTLGL